jgi:tetratricopeptide (TPR) repeat protein
VHAALLLALAALASCTRSAPRPPAALRFEVAGCARVLASGSCELGAARRLTLWAESRVLEVHAGAQQLTLEKRAHVQGGLRVEVEVPADASVLELRGQARADRLVLARDSYPPELAALKALRASGKLDELQERLAAEAQRPRDACGRARLAGLRARLAFSRGKVDEAIAHYRASVPALLGCGLVSEAAADSFALFYALSEQKREVQAAERVLDELEPRLGADADARAWLAHYRGGAALRLGAWGAALSSLSEAQDRAERLALTQLEASALQTRAWVESLLGRHDLAARSMARALERSAGGGPCERATALTNAGYQQLLAAEAGHTSAAAARAPLLEALTLSEVHCAGHPLTPRILVNLAQGSVLEGELERARSEITRAAAAPLAEDVMLHVTVLDVRGRTLHEAGSFAQALAVYDELSLRLSAASAALPQGELGRGRALMALGRARDAAVALERAEAELDRQIGAVPLSVGRESFAFGRREVSRRLIEALLAQGDVEGALAAAMRAHARVLGSLVASPARGDDTSRADALATYVQLREEMDKDAQRAWRLPADQLPALARMQDVRRKAAQDALDRAWSDATPAPLPSRRVPGEAVLALVELERDVALIVRDDAGSFAVRAAGDGIAAALEPLLPRLRESRRVTVLSPTSGPLASVHALELAGAPLLAHVPLAYSAGLWRKPAPELGPRHRVVFLIDARGDLAGARREGVWLRGQLQGRPHVDWREGREITRARLLGDLASARALHFAGHASYAADSFWDSGLLLAQGSIFTIADILAQPRVPARVVLSACESATAAPAGQAVGLGIAQAFLARGAEEVVATTAPVDDRVAAEFTRAFYAAPQHGEEDAALALQRAVMALRERALSWESYRLLVP